MSQYSIWEGTDDEFARRMQEMIRASGGRIQVISAYRSVERQAQLYADAVRKYGSEAAARKWVAPPGRSNHNRGLAVDLSYTGDGREWAHQNAYRFGLHFPMDHEPWHIEPIGVRDGTYNRNEQWIDAYTDPPLGVPPAVGRPKTMEDQFMILTSMLMSPSSVEDMMTSSQELDQPDLVVPGLESAYKSNASAKDQTDGANQFQ